jgi:cell wall-associated NlpC family hydrolase/LysM repeat protein
LGLALLATGSVLGQHSTHGTGSYVVKHGENDWIIAHRHHLTVPQLHRLNPEIHWASLRPGDHLSLSAPMAAHPHPLALRPSKPARAVAGSKVAVQQAEAHKAPGQKVSVKQVLKVASGASSTRNYTVKDGENDWIIAHRIGTTTVALKRMNPGVNLGKLRDGQKIRIPITAVARSVNRIHSRYAVINGDNVNVRRGAGSSSELVAQVDAGTRVVVLDQDGEWYRLKFPHGTEGWVRGGLLKAVAPARAERVEHIARRRRARQDAEYVSRDHRRAHAEAAEARHIHREAVASRAGHHRATSLAWSESDFSDNGDESGKILHAASAFRGVRYHWGSMSRSATDCSGFTSQVFKSEGFKIPRTSSEQSMSGQPVHSGDLKAGDLVFFHTMRGARVTHVGIYIGGGKFVHASSAGGHVQVNSLNEGYYNHRLVAARRIAKHKADVRAQAAAHKEPEAPKPIAPTESAPPKPAEQPQSLSSIGQ